MTIASIALQAIIGLVFLFTGFVKLTTPKENLPGKGVTGFENIKPNLIKLLGVTEVIGALILLLFSIPSLPQFPIQLATAGFTLLMIGASFHHYKHSETKSMFTALVLLFVCVLLFLLKWQTI